jgi:tRNA (guanine-N7-)-methyltransferase
MSGSRGHYPARLRLVKPSKAICDFYITEWYGGHLYHTPERFGQLSSSRLFGNDNPIEIDIGSGTAEYLRSHVKERASVNFIGIERAQKPLYYAVRQCAASELTNVRFFRTDARLLLPVFAPGSIRAVYLHFPIPVLKRHERKHEIFNGLFLDLLNNILHDNGILSVMTDSLDYYNKMLSMLTPNAWYTIETDPEICAQVDSMEKSYYHRLWHIQGRPAPRFLLEKKNNVVTIPPVFPSEPAKNVPLVFTQRL